MPLLLFQLHPVRGGRSSTGPCGDRASFHDGPSVKKEFLGQGGLPGVGVTNDGEGAAAQGLLADLASLPRRIRRGGGAPHRRR